jgi:Ran GTPase-activating protein (RanGAP) involved in mRNA processing and transport
VTSVSYFEWGAYPPHDPENYCNYTALCDLPHLEEIEVFDSAFPLDVLKNIPTLQRLAITQNGLRDDDMNVISTLHGLQTLSLRLNDITDSGAQKLSRLPNLTELDLSGNFVSAETISELQLSLPHCRIKNDWCRADTPKSSKTAATEPSGEPEPPITRALNP